jgi:hypothetical protein
LYIAGTRLEKGAPLDRGFEFAGSDRHRKVERTDLWRGNFDVSTCDLSSSSFSALDTLGNKSKKDQTLHQRAFLSF